MYIDCDPDELKNMKGTYFPSVKRMIVSCGSSAISVIAILYGFFATSWTGTEFLDVILIFIVAIAAFAIGVLTYGGKVEIDCKILEVGFFFGIKRYSFELDRIDWITLVIDDYKFTPLTIQYEGKIFPMPANERFIEQVRKLQPVAGGDATRWRS